MVEEKKKLKNKNFKRLISFSSCQKQYSAFGSPQTGDERLKGPSDGVCAAA